MSEKPKIRNLRKPEIGKGLLLKNVEIGNAREHVGASIPFAKVAIIGKFHVVRNFATSQLMER